MKTTIALVGIGGYGQVYLADLLNAAPEREIELVAGIDPYPEGCAMLPVLQEAAVPIYPTLEAFFAASRADLVIISAPIHQHAPLTRLALANGAYVLCEKPLAGSLEDAESMRKAERAAGKPVAVGYQWSFSDATLALKRDILAGKLGQPLRAKTITLWPRAHSYFRRNRWAGRITAEDGSAVLDSPLNNATAHYLHHMLFLLGDRLETAAHPQTVDAHLWRANNIENYDTAALLVQTHSGVEVLFSTTHAVIEQHGPLMEMEFADAVVTYPTESYTFQARYHDGQIVDYGSPDASASNKLWTTIDVLRGGGVLPCGIETALPHLECVVAAQQQPIQSFPAGRVQHTPIGESDAITWVDGLGEEMLAAYRKSMLY